MANQIFIDGDADEIQLRVQGHSTQTEPLQTWEDSAGTELALVTDDGRLVVGEEDGTSEALVEVHNLDDPARPNLGLHSTAIVSGTLNSLVRWIRQALTLQGSAGVDARHVVQEITLTNENTGDLTANAELIGTHILVDNDGGAGGTAYGLKVEITDTGSLDAIYALYTEGGIAHFGDELELPAFSSPPAGNPPSGAMKFYVREVNGQPQLYLKNPSGQEYTVALSPSSSFADIIEALEPLFWLPLTEQSGSIADNALYTAVPGSELLSNADLTSWAGDDPDGWAVVGESGSDPEVTERGSGQQHSDSPGTGSANLYSTATVSEPRIQQTILTIGETYHAEIYISHSSDLAKIRAENGSQNFVFSSYLGSVPGLVAFDFVATNTIFRIRALGSPNDHTIDSASVKKVGELDGGYVGPTVDDDVFAGSPCPTFDGINDYIQLDYTGLESVFDPAEGTMVIFAKATGAVIGDSNWHLAIEIGYNDSNRFYLAKSSVADRWTAEVSIGGVSKALHYTAPTPANQYDQWIPLILRWSATGNFVRFNVGDATAVSDTYPSGTWTTNNLAQTRCRIGSQASTLYWDGSLAAPHVVARAISDTEVADLLNAIALEEAAIWEV